jgi:hypothetical protein
MMSLVYSEQYVALCVGVVAGCPEGIILILLNVCSILAAWL